ncbi:T-complex protein 1 subunit beta [Aduncisulcus paluster]|uniref:CCT-beta n=1 Tax=Aduncisulcus paluster TaxID=2918883 RepID=A0ABQ5JYU5_9EUKA|nr:T-complex protein 1 subunit beta [Aduncisulcus paluster]
MQLEGAITLAESLKSTLGPKGQDKILLSASGTGAAITITNDGATIMKSIHVDIPAAQLLINLSQVQDKEIGDGTTSVCVLTGCLLKEAVKLLEAGLHPMTIISGFRKSCEIAKKALIESSVDHKADPKKFYETLMNVARTCLSSKILHHNKELFSKLAVDAVLKLEGDTDLTLIQIIKKSGSSLADSYLDDGFIMDKQIGIGCPRQCEDCKIMIANTPMDTDKIKIYGSQVCVKSASDMAAIERAEQKRMEDKCQKIIDCGVNVFVNRSLVYDIPMQYLSRHNVMVIEHADFEGVERLSSVCGGEIASTFDHPELLKIGHCDKIEECVIGEDRLIRFSGVHHSKASTIVLRGASSHILEEAERSLHDALCVLSQTIGESEVVFGGGCSEMLMAKAVDDAARIVEGKESLAMEAYATALRSIPGILAENGGMDSSDIIAALRAAHYKGDIRAGLDITTGGVGDMEEIGITESLKSKRQVLISASEAAEQFLRVDDVLVCEPERGP